MLDKNMEMMLSVANTLTAEDIEQIKSTTPVPDTQIELLAPPAEDVPVDETTPEQEVVASSDGSAAGGVTQGERERKRTRASKIATACVGQERPKHDWWPVGTELIGHIGSELFTGVVVENPRLKSGRSIQITSGSAAGKVCITPTRAAIEATEAYRQANNLGRGGGVTNGWTFWKAKS